MQLFGADSSVDATILLKDSFFCPWKHEKIKLKVA